MLTAGPTLVVADAIASPRHAKDNAVLVRGGRVAAVGAEADFDTAAIAVERYAGTTLVPALGDSHFHPLGFTTAVTNLNVARCADFDELAHKVRDAARSLPPGTALIGTRLNDESMVELRLPTRHDLDRMVSDRPVVLYRYCGHIAVANTAALDAAGVGPATSDPVGGAFDRDESGSPNGILREMAVSVVGDELGGRTGTLQPEDLLRSLDGLVATGVTRLGAIISTASFCGVSNELDLLLSVSRDLPLHLSVLVHAATADEFESAAERLDNAGRRISFLGMKDFTDGSLGGHTAALRAPYTDAPGELGTDRFDLERIAPVAERSLAMGGMVALHAIGDQACRSVIDYFAELRANGVAADQLRIEHASVLTDDDVTALAATGAVASVQPAFLSSETTWLGKRLGDRVDLAYRFKTMADAGITLAGGSDCPVEPPFPLAGIATAQDRAGIVPSEGVSGAEAVAMFTDGVSAAIRQPAPLSVGSRADFTFLDINPITASPQETREAQVIATWIDGEAHLGQPIEWDQ